jgi:ribosomal subunit interface protein
MGENTVAHHGVDKAITIQSSNIHLGDGLPDYARENILRVASKYFGRLNSASAHFTKEGITYRCSVNMHMGGLPMKSAEARDKDIYLAFNAASRRLPSSFGEPSMSFERIRPSALIKM